MTASGIISTIKICCFPGRRSCWARFWDSSVEKTERVWKTQGKSLYSVENEKG